jgi:methylenetetrahydromethanopterin dehydrogenase
VLRVVQNELDRVIESMKAGAQANLPTLTVTAEQALAAAEFTNPYAAAKAYAALTIAEAVAGVTTRGCFVEQDPAQYVTLVAAGHELMRSAAALADCARELEKANDSLLRTPHAASGQVRRKTRLGEKPS